MIAEPTETHRTGVLIRVVAGALVIAFLFVSVVTTVRSLGSYCLTSNGGDTTTLPK